jgi:hypothetical protein
MIYDIVQAAIRGKRFSEPVPRRGIGTGSLERHLAKKGASPAGSLLAGTGNYYRR